MTAPASVRDADGAAHTTGVRRGIELCQALEDAVEAAEKLCVIEAATEGLAAQAEHSTIDPLQLQAIARMLHDIRNDLEAALERALEEAPAGGSGGPR